MSASLYAAASLCLLLALCGSVFGAVYFARQMRRRRARPGLTTATFFRAKKARDQIISEAVLVAAELSRVDGLIAPQEMDAVRDFIVDHIKRADHAFAARMMRKGFEREGTPLQIAARLEAIRRLGDDDQCSLVLDFLIYVARSDGVLVAEERAFLLKAGEALGISHSSLERRLEDA